MVLNFRTVSTQSLIAVWVVNSYSYVEDNMHPRRAVTVSGWKEFGTEAYP